MCILGGQIKLAVTRTMKTSSAFCNKIWQAARFLLLARERKPEFQPTKIQPASQHSQSFENQWILSQCAHAITDISQHWHNRDFHWMNRDIRQFLYFCLCDVYLESVKRVLNEPQHPEFDDTLRTLYVCITTGLRLLHPLMPFLTEELYQRINAVFEVTCSSISTESYPTPSEVSSQLYLRNMGGETSWLWWLRLWKFKTIF